MLLNKMAFKSDNQRKAVMAKLNQGYVRSDVKPKIINVKKHPLTIEQTFVPQGAGNNPEAGKRDLHYKIKEWGFVFPTKASAEKFANDHIEKNGVIVKR